MILGEELGGGEWVLEPLDEIGLIGRIPCRDKCQGCIECLTSYSPIAGVVLRLVAAVAMVLNSICRPFVSSLHKVVVLDDVRPPEFRHF